MDFNALHILIQVLFGILIILWAVIIFSLLSRRIRLAQLQKIEGTFAKVTSEYLYPLSNEKPNLIAVQRAFRKVGVVESKPRNVQYLIDLMIRAQRSFLGENYLKLGVLFKQIPPFRASQSKLESKKWYIKARGIREIYEMDQRQHVKMLIKERNNSNIFVRREAQIAMVVFLGWESLRFLPYLRREMTLWQQIKIVEKLHDLYPQPVLEYLRRTYGTRRPYAQELIMRIIRKFHLKDEVHYILKFLDHPVFDRREAAIYCISSFYLDDNKMQVVKQKFFEVPNTEQQAQLLKYINRTSETVDLQFYQEVLYRGNDLLKLSAAEILWHRGHKKMIQDFYYRQYSGQALEAQPEW